jgi:nitrogen regulatory protein P-II 1
MTVFMAGDLPKERCEGKFNTTRRLSSAGDPGSIDRLFGQARTGILNDTPSSIAHRSRNHAVKLIVAVIQPTKLKAVREALLKIEVTRMTVCDAQGYARQRGQNEQYRGNEYKSNLLRKVALEILVNDDFVDRTLDTLQAAARTGPEGSIGDGKIFVMPCERVLRISDSLTGPEAV